MDNSADFLRFEDSDEDENGGLSEHEDDKNCSTKAEKQAGSMHDDKHAAAIADEHNVDGNSGVEDAASAQHDGDDTIKHINKAGVKPIGKNKAAASSIADSESPDHSTTLDSAQAGTVLNPSSSGDHDTSSQHTTSDTTPSTTTSAPSSAPSTNPSTEPSTAPFPATSSDPIASLTSLSSNDLTNHPSSSTTVPTPQRAISAPPLFDLSPNPAAASPENCQIEIIPNPWLTYAPCVLYYTQVGRAGSFLRFRGVMGRAHGEGLTMWRYVMDYGKDGRDITMREASWDRDTLFRGLGPA
ncbi:hypothetical protein KVT40_004522 [Elsinoe batatas]|uniref:Uncharacterized protein n=1 Tax=Elsinoe batatas TaxID=2601811 RepID=A0A8K0L250_9PEZI|nr:hypothetical protein KVT40_004522 [Elsinoe batatas]